MNSTKHNLYCKALLIAAITIIAFTGPAWASQVTEHGITINLFDEIIEIEEEKDAFLPSYRTDPGAIRALAAKADRAGTVILNEAAMAPRALSPGDRLLMGVFSDQTYRINIEQVEEKLHTARLRGTVEGSQYGVFIMSSYQDQTMVVLRLPEDNILYVIQYSPAEEAYQLFEAPLDQFAYPKESPALVPPEIILDEADEIKAPDLVVSGDPHQPATIDVMVVYTPAARLWAGGPAGINNHINSAMVLAQETNDNSRTGINLNLVHTAEVSYLESGNMTLDLMRLTNTSDGYMDPVHTWRDQYGADLVVLLNSGHQGGIGWLFYNLPQYGFSISNVQWVGTSYLMIHEIGHNLGAHHHKEQNYQPGPHTWLNSYSAGWRFEWNSNWYNTLMSYSGGHYFDPPAPGAGITSIEIGYFSNPDLAVAGTDIKLGHPADGDNARTLRETKHRVAAFRDGTVNGAAELVIERLEVEPATSALGTELTATMVIKNRGTADVTRNFWIDFYENLASSPHPHQDGDQNWQLGYLEAGAAHKFTYHFTPENAGTKYAWGQVDAGTQVSDSPALFGPVTYTITALPPCAVSTPDPPSGPGSGETNTSYTYFTGGASCAAGHSVQYRFDWGDGTSSSWSALAGRSKSWSTAGSYQVRAQARCAEDNRVLSDWSKGKLVTISKAEPVPYILDQAVFNVDGILVAVCLDDYSAAFKIKGNLLWEFLRGDRDFPDAQAVGSGGKYIDLDQYCDNYIDNVSEAIKYSDPLPADVVATFKTIAGFDADGNPVLIPINSAGAEG